MKKVMLKLEREERYCAHAVVAIPDHLTTKEEIQAHVDEAISAADWTGESELANSLNYRLEKGYESCITTCRDVVLEGEEGFDTLNDYSHEGLLTIEEVTK